MLGFIAIIFLVLVPSLWLYKQIIENYNLSEENKELKERIKSLEKESTNWSFRSLPIIGLQPLIILSAVTSFACLPLIKKLEIK